MPIIDLRPFAADLRVATSVRLPGLWDEGEFVRGLGPLRLRLRRAPWSAPTERVFVDFRNSLRFDSGATALLTQEHFPLVAKRLIRRAWLPLPTTPPCIYALDVAVPLDMSRRPPQPPEALEISSVLDVARTLWSLNVRVRNTAQNSEMWVQSKLASAPAHLAHNLAIATTSTTAVQIATSLVGVGKPVVAIEATALRYSLPIDARVDRYRLGGIDVLHVPPDGARRPRTYVILASPTGANRQAIREIRTHILRLSAIQSFLESLLREESKLSASIADRSEPQTPSRLVADALLLSLEYLSRARTAHAGELGGMLSGAFRAYEFLNNSVLDSLEARLLSNLDADARNALRRFASAEAERALADRALESMRDSDGVVNIYQSGASRVNYDQRFSNIGAAGDNARAEHFVQSRGRAEIQVGGNSFRLQALIDDLERLRKGLETVAQDRLGGPAEVGAEGKQSGATFEGATGQAALEAAQDLQVAETAVRNSRGEEATSALRRTGGWVLRFAEAIGTTVAAAAIKSAIGL